MKDPNTLEGSNTWKGYFEGTLKALIKFVADFELEVMQKSKEIVRDEEYNIEQLRAFLSQFPHLLEMVKNMKMPEEAEEAKEKGNYEEIMKLTGPSYPPVPRPFFPYDLYKIMPCGGSPVWVDDPNSRPYYGGVDYGTGSTADNVTFSNGATCISYNTDAYEQLQQSRKDYMNSKK